MGTGSVIKCKNCGAEKSFYFGTGMQFISGLESYIETKKLGATKRKIQKILQTNNPVDEEFCDRLFTCPNCNTIHQKAYINIKKNGILLYESEYKCVKCHCKLLMIPEDIEDVSHYNCSSCGQQALENYINFNWD